MSNATVDLVCGPADPLPGSEQSYRLTGLLGSGGQADVYQAVRVSAGISSAPLSVKVLRINPHDTREHQFRSWDKGDAVLMDLHGRDVGSICRRIDAFYGRLPHPPGQAPQGDPVPFQVLEYLPGHDLRQLLQRRLGRVDAARTLRSVATVMNAMHHPPVGVHPVLHMDLKPANVIIGPDGSAKVIDFTGARYYTPAHLTTIAYTRETAGPEAHRGSVGPAYDVHGFGSIAFYLVTGASARTDSPGQEQSVPWARLRRHPVLESNPRLRELLTAPLDDDPNNRPRTEELPRWINELCAVVARSNVPDLGVDWTLGYSAGNGAFPVADATRRLDAPGVGGATRRIDQHQVAPPTVVASPAAVPVDGTRVMEAGMSPTKAVPDKPVAGRVRVPEQGSFQPGRSAGPVSPAGRGELPRLRLATDPAEPDDRAAEKEDRPPLLGPPGSLAKGFEFSVIGGLFSLVMWLLQTLTNGLDSMRTQVFSYLFVLAVAIGLFFLIRVAGGILWGRWLHAKRKTARLAHLGTGIFLFMVGVNYLTSLDWGWSPDLSWLDPITDIFEG
ncbi:protein kinase [Glycomyces sp. TRM65418]|uniref:serine/threonine protein kinase n=1 Tax=Glycomyces sp. TRM65418 TaxID=2867006 RepID=UPI001CE6861F|nr:protein kinase [Glycomyces sp. TRM65418]MCC3762151.1 protein kinase [Glycomyces sp. TRM65418]QZD56215.1 protein kinase [Glycomyces sp. TRM65418]